MSRILVGVDGSKVAAAALSWAAGLAGPLDARLVVATAWVPSQIEMPPEFARAERDELGRTLDDEWCGPARDAGVVFDSEVLGGEPPDALLDAADRHDAVLLVVGTRGAGGFAGLRLGSVADYVAHRTTRPLAVIPADAGLFRGVRRIVLGIDGAEDSLWPVGFCGLLAQRLRAEVVAVNAFRPPVEWVPENAPASWHTETMRLLEGRWTDPLRQVGVRVRGRIEENNHAAEALLAAAEDEDAELIVVGTRSLSGWRMLRLGGVTMQLLHHSDRAVVIVPPPA